MCFSATVSFTASGILTVTGAATLKQSKKPSEWLLASAPLAFGIQQFAEGVLWLSIGTQSPFKSIAVYTFLFFAFVWWPAVVPLAVYFMEKDALRKRLLKAFVGLGFLVAFVLFYHLLTKPVSADIAGHSIRYFLDDPHSRALTFQSLLIFLYLSAVVGSCALSGHRFIRRFGFFILLFFFISIGFFKVALVSVWCFFAAILSLFLFWHFWKKRRA